jgi:hypothetical protein
MNIEALIAATHAKRKAAGLCVSFDGNEPGSRPTRTFATLADRDAGLARLTAQGRNPRVEE